MKSNMTYYIKDGAISSVTKTNSIYIAMDFQFELTADNKLTVFVPVVGQLQCNHSIIEEAGWLPLNTQTMETAIISVINDHPVAVSDSDITFTFQNVMLNLDTVAETIKRLLRHPKTTNAKMVLQDNWSSLPLSGLQHLSEQFQQLRKGIHHLSLSLSDGDPNVDFVRMVLRDYPNLGDTLHG